MTSSGNAVPTAEDRRLLRLFQRRVISDPKKAWPGSDGVVIRRVNEENRHHRPIGGLEEPGA
jgi:hypothetical protein